MFISNPLYIRINDAFQLNLSKEQSLCSFGYTYIHADYRYLDQKSWGFLSWSSVLKTHDKMKFSVELKKIIAIDEWLSPLTIIHNNTLKTELTLIHL